MSIGLWLLIVLGSGSGALVGIIGSVIASSFNRRILQDVGLAKLPADPRERYRLISERCWYASKWTKMDSYNLSVFIVGLVFLTSSLVIELVEAATRTQVTIDGMPITWILLLSAVIFVLLSLTMMMSRFSFLIHLSQASTSKEAPAIAARTAPAKQLRATSLVWLPMLVPLIAVILSFVATYVGTMAVIASSVLIVLLIVLAALRERKKGSTPHD